MLVFFFFFTTSSYFSFQDLVTFGFHLLVVLLLIIVPLKFCSMGWQAAAYRIDIPYHAKACICSYRFMSTHAKHRVLLSLSI